MTHRPLLAALWLGILTQMLIQGYDRFLYVKFPINLFGLMFLGVTLLGAGLGALASRWGARHRAALEPIFLISVVLFLVGLCLNRNVSVHFLLTNQYYPYPRPTHWQMRTAGIVISWVLSAGLLAYIVGSFVRVLVAAKELPRTVGVYAAGLAVGGIASYFAHATLGPYRTLMLWGLATLPLFDRRALRNTALIAIAGIAVVSEHRIDALKSNWTAPAPFLWRQTGHELQSRHWTPHYKLDFVSFKQDRCLGGVYNNLMLWYHCDDPDLLPSEISAIFRVTGENKKSVLAIGRTDSMYLSLIERWHGPIERSLSLEFDETVVEQVTGPYSRYFNDRWKQPGHEARAGNLRTMLDEIDETFDLVYLNGQMIRLYLQPRMLLPQEDYLFARDSLEKMMKLLNPGGLLIVDWGSSQEAELYDVVSNVPEGAHATAFWSTMSNPPMAGLPLFFVFISRDAATVDRIAADIQALGMDEERARIIPIDPTRMTPVDTQDRPFLQAGLAMGYTLLPTFALIPLAFVLLGAGLRSSPLGERWSVRSHRGYFLAAGVLLGSLETLVVGRFSTAHPAGSPMGAALLAPIFLGGIVLACAAVSRQTRDASRVPIAASFASTAAGLALGITAPDSLPAMIAASLLLGFGGGYVFVAMLARQTSEWRASAWGWQALGIVLGLLALQPVMIQFGFRDLALVLGALALAMTAWLSGRLTST